MRRLFGLSVAAGLVGGALVILGGRSPWRPEEVLGVPTAPDAHASVAASLGAVVLLGTLVVAVTRAAGRRLSGAVVALSAAGAVVAVLTADADWVPWRGAALAGAVLGLVAGGLAAWQGHRWASMSSRYDAPGARPPHESDPWKALDRGEDPTV
ncbi:MAG TPA: Trp biosynthesis-associated membrane protein [Nocardioidaceae bacterium]|nr:Trp biosynthesis-associated membrane protein [Nocardioidaceae bacterium]